MAVKVNRSGFQYAESLIKKGRVVADEVDDWSAHQPSSDDENRFIQAHGWSEYGRWHLGVDDEATPETKAHYKFPSGDFEKVHRCALRAADRALGSTSRPTSSGRSRTCTGCSRVLLRGRRWTC
jgi:hypothetical protein